MNEPDAVRGYRAANEVLDEAPREQTRATILAAAGRAVEARPRAVDRVRRWRFPLAAAATVLIGAIAVLVATRTEREADQLATAPAEAAAQPSADIYAPEPPATAPEAMRSHSPSPLAERPQLAPPVQKSEAPAVAAAPAAGDAVASAEARSERRAAAGESVGTRAARESAPTASAANEPEPAQWVERIVALRAAGRDDEADRELKRFRERHPDFKLPAAALRKQAPESR